MATKTGVIKFNVTQRGRKFRGVERNFDTVAMANLINGGEVQEKVKHRDMLGYFGHWARVKFGLNPVEGGIVDGKHVSLEPAIVTTLLKAHPDGTIEHETEFLDTASGKLAERLFKSNAGGFSSAIDTKRAGDKQVPIGFYGFDYVLEPNFTTNRGYAVALDGVMDAENVFDAVAEQNAMYDTLNHLFDSLQQAYDMQAVAMARVMQENQDLINMLAKANSPKPEPSLDSIMELMGGNRGGKMFDADNFHNATLASYQQERAEKKPETQADRIINTRYGFI
jgi:hypothetical protein